MGEFLEAAMLICFGLSWPLSVVKNLRSGSAKSMSLPFILLITVGYLAGICAKLITGRINYVLTVYLINLLFVSANIVIYVINKKKDKEKERKKEYEKLCA